MCNVTVIEFFIESVERKEFEKKRVLKVGSKYVNGSVKARANNPPIIFEDGKQLRVFIDVEDVARATRAM
jgi:nucleoside-diphosphate-sugar epimerase